MRIGIDARALQSRNRGMGVERVLRNLLLQWVKSDDGNEYILYFDSPERSLPHEVSSSAKVMERTIKSNVVKYGSFWENCLLTSAIRKDKADVLFSPAYTTPLLPCGAAKVVVIHDISYKTMPEEYKPKQAFMLNMFSDLSAHVSSRVVTISGYSKAEIVKHYRIEPRKVSVIHCGVEDKFVPIHGKAPVCLKINRRCIAGKYILYVGTMFARRHLKQLMDAFELLLANGHEIKLILVGENMTVPFLDVEARLASINARSGREVAIHFKKVSEAELLALYQNCELFAYLSDYEGFGLPPLEAMACGKPVVTGNRSSIPEVVGEGAVCVDVEDTEAVFESVRKILGSVELRDELSKKARERAAGFSWKRASEEYLRLFAEAVAKDGQ